MLEGTTLVAEQALSVLRTAVIEDGFLRAVEANYKRQAADEPFTSLGEFLGWGNLARYTSVSVADFFASHGVSKELVDYAAVPLTRMTAVSAGSSRVAVRSSRMLEGEVER